MSKTSLQSQVSQNHRRVISVRLRLLEEYCLRLLELFHPLEATFTSRAELPKAKAEGIERCVEALRSAIGGIKGDLGLEHQERDARREASALVATMMIDIEELQPRHLKGYGACAEPLSRYLQERLEALADVLKKMNRVLREEE